MHMQAVRPNCGIESIMKHFNHYLRMAAATIGVILPVTNAIAWPASMRATVLAVSGALLTIEHSIQSSHKTKTKAAAAAKNEVK
jgi:hypothetical protein